MNTYSGFGEDSWILKNLPLPDRGVFVDVGAFDGRVSSNTLAFEESGWSGLCVEPYPANALACKRNRRCPTVFCAVGTGASMQPLEVNTADLGTCGLRRPATGNRFFVQVLRLDWLCDLFGIDKIDLLSIDTEGSEVEVWHSAGQLRPQIVIAEFRTEPQPPSLPALEEAIIPCGYRLVHTT